MARLEPGGPGAQARLRIPQLRRRRILKLGRWMLSVGRWTLTVARSRGLPPLGASALLSAAPVSLLLPHWLLHSTPASPTLLAATLSRQPKQIHDRSDHQHSDDHLLPEFAHDQ